jgi:cytolysin-activating lysine-acyltransferase
MTSHLKDASSAPVLEAGAQQDLDQIAALARTQAHKVMKKIPLLGPVTWLMMSSAATRNTLLSELEWRVLPALVLDQSKLYFREASPLAYASWAMLSEDAAQRYRQAPHHLAASDWQSGSQIWLVDVLAPFGGIPQILADLRETVFKGQPVRQLLPLGKTDPQVLTWPAVEGKTSAPADA